MQSLLSQPVELERQLNESIGIFLNKTGKSKVFYQLTGLSLSLYNLSLKPRISEMNAEKEESRTNLKTLYINGFTAHPQIR